MRALLIVNPRATSTTRLRRDVIASALASAVQLEVTETRYRGHAAKLASAARAEGYGLVLTLGGDGTVNEAANGILGGSPAHADLGDPPTHGDLGDQPAQSKTSDPPADGKPRAPMCHGMESAALLALAPLPGAAPTSSLALGLPRDPVDATGQILQASSRRTPRANHQAWGWPTPGTSRSTPGSASTPRSCGLFKVCAHTASRSRQRCTSGWLRQFYRQTDRRHPSIAIGTEPGPGRGPRVFLAIVSNTAPWTYLGSHEVHANPEAGFDTGLDLFALRKMSTFNTFTAIGRMLTADGDGPLRGRNFLSHHDQACVTLRASRPVAFQIDGEYVGEREAVVFRSVPRALRVIA